MNSHPSVQLECLWKHLEYLDSNVMKILSIYFGFSGLILANLNKFSEAIFITCCLVGVITIIFFLLLYRTSSLIQEVKTKIIEVDNVLRDKGGIESTIPSIYINSKMKTSVVGYISILLFGSALIIHISGIFNL